jgi:hypothetical protein
MPIPPPQHPLTSRRPVPPFRRGTESEWAYHAIQCLDVVLKHRMMFNKDALPLGRAFYFHDRNVRSIGGGAEVRARGRGGAGRGQIEGGGRELSWLLWGLSF